MLQTYLILKKYFLHNDYPSDVLNYVMFLYMSKGKYKLYYEDDWLLQSPSGELRDCTPNELILPPVRKVIQYYKHTIIVTCKNQLYRCEYNKVQMLLDNIKDIIKDNESLLVITTNGDLCRFKNKLQQPFLSNIKDAYFDSRYQNTGFMITGSNEFYARVNTPSFTLKKVIFPDNFKVKDIKIGEKSIILTTDGELWNYRRRADPHIIPIPKVRKIYYANGNLLVITSTNEIYTWSDKNHGRNKPKNLDLSNIKDAVLSDAYDIAMALTYNGDIYFWKEQFNFSEGVYYVTYKASLSNVRKIYCINNCLFAITHDNILYTMDEGFKVLTPRRNEISDVKELIHDNYHVMIVTYSNKKYLGKAYGSNLHDMKEI